MYKNVILFIYQQEKPPAWWFFFIVNFVFFTLYLYEDY